MQKRNIIQMLTGLMLATSSVPGQEIPAKNLSVLQVESKSFKDAPKKIFIKDFKIYYQMIAETEQTSLGSHQIEGGLYNTVTPGRLAVGIEGISPNDLQSLTNDIYNNYVDELKGLGMEVYSPNNYPGLQYYQDMQRLNGPQISEEQLKGSLLVVPEKFSYFVNKATQSDQELIDPPTKFDSLIYQEGLMDVSKELEDMIVVDIAVYVPSIYLHPKSVLGTIKIKGGSRLQLENARATYVSGKLQSVDAVTPKHAIEVTLKKPIKIPEVFGSQDFKPHTTDPYTVIPSYARFFTEENIAVRLSNTITCKSSVYKEEVGGIITEFLHLSVEKLQLGLDGKKAK